MTDRNRSVGREFDEFLAQLDGMVAGPVGEQIVAICLFGSYGQPAYQPRESDVNLLLLLDDGGDICAVRDRFRPLWDRFGSWLRRGPWVARLNEFHRFVQLNPDFAQELAQNGRFLHGELPPLPPTPTPDPHETMARLATEALTASSALLPGLLDPETAQTRRLALRRLARQLWQEPIPEGETAVATFARLRHLLDAKINRLPAARAWHNEKVPTSTTLLLPGAQALYKQGSYFVIVLADFKPAQVQEASLARLTERLAGKCEGVMLATAVQLSLSLVYDNPLGLALRGYQHIWGLNPLAGLQTSKRQIMRQSALAAANISLIDLPQVHFTQTDDDLHTLIHDFQNKLLNLRLQHELLHRLGHLSSYQLPNPLPERETPSRQRLEAIYQQLDWWAAQYKAEMDQTTA